MFWNYGIIVLRMELKASILIARVVQIELNLVSRLGITLENHYALFIFLVPS